MLCVIFYLLEISRSDALGADREESKAEGHAGQDRKVRDIIADRVRCQGCGSETGDET